ncbi:MAG: glycosyltransferase family 4 protein [Limisphaerales bacterium]
MNAPPDPTPPSADAPFRPRVLVLPASYFASRPTVGGGERYALEYARALARLTPTTLAFFDRTPTRRQDGDLGVRTFGIRHERERWLFPATGETWRAWSQYDVFHLMVFPTPAADLLLLKARLARKTAVLTDVGGGTPCWSTYLGKLHPGLPLSRRADGLAFLSNYAAKFFDGWPQPRTVLLGGVNPALFEGAAGRPEGYALFVGRLLPHKGVLPLVEAVDADTPLRVVGRPYDAAYFDQVKAAAAGKQVTFITDADDAELKRQYAGANVVLQVSVPADRPELDKAELLGLVTLEGMAMGKPVIITRTASLPELVVDGVTGHIVPPHDRPALAARLRELVNDPKLSLRLGAAARDHVARHFTWEATARRGLDFYRTLAAKRGTLPPAVQPG